MDAWLTQLDALRTARPTTRAVAGTPQPVPGVSFDTHLREALAEPGPGPAPAASWSDVYLREAGLMMGAPLLGLTDDEEAPVEPLRVEATHAA